MLNVLGENYFVDLDRIESYIDMSEISEISEIPQGMTETINTSEMRINIVKYEMIKMLLEVVLSENSEVDEKLGMKNSNNITIPFKIAFNSLLNKNIINHY
jgi:hypothetical protein